jgi:hypothetical protein
MPFTVEDGSGRADATSFCSVADADSYLGTTSTAWTGSATSTKQTALEQATRFIAQTYEGEWSGTRAYELQALPWPRSCAYDSDGYAVGWNSIPRNLRHATIEAARRHVEGTVLVPDQDGGGSTRKEEIAVGPIRISTEFSSPRSGIGDDPASRFPAVERLLRPLLRRGNAVRLG